MVEIPAFDMPFAARLSPHVDRVRQHTRTWVRDMGMLTGGPWTEAYFDQADFGSFAALTHPAAGLAELELLGDLHVWAWYVGDVFLDGFNRTRDVVGGKAFVARLKSVLDDPALPVLTPAERALADLVSRSTMDSGDRATVAEFLDALLWQLHNNAQARVPDPVDYVEMNRQVAATTMSARLARKSVGAELPDDLLANSTMRALVDSFGDMVSLRADLMGYGRFGPDTGLVTNAVAVVRQFFGCDAQQGVNLVADLVNARMRQFATSAAADLPDLGVEYGLDAEQQAALSRYVEALKSWLAGELLWTQRTGRYLPHPTPSTGSFHRPTGLGTAAVLVR